MVEKSIMDNPRLVIERHQSAINNRDLIAYIDTTAFPFTYQNFNGTSLTVENSAQYGNIYPAPWETIIATFPEWIMTEHEEVKQVVASKSSVVFLIKAKWVTNNSIVQKPITLIWIAVKKHKKWGVQFRHNLGTID